MFLNGRVDCIRDCGVPVGGGLKMFAEFIERFLIWSLGERLGGSLALQLKVR